MFTWQWEVTYVNLKGKMKIPLMRRTRPIALSRTRMEIRTHGRNSCHIMGRIRAIKLSRKILNIMMLKFKCADSQKRAKCDISRTLSCGILSHPLPPDDGPTSGSHKIQNRPKKEGMMTPAKASVRRIQKVSPWHCRIDEGSSK
jgi:hypothetical protein